MKTTFWQRRKFFDAYGSRINEQKADLPPNGMRVTCPCCGYPTTSGETYEICDLCSWEDDGQDDLNADEILGGPNQGYSLVEARQNFEKYLVMYPPEEDPSIGGPDSDNEKQIKQNIIAAFDKMMEEPTPEELNGLWQKIAQGEKALYKELKRRTREYSSQMRDD